MTRYKERRIQLGLSVQQVADRLGKHRATVYRYENGDIQDMTVETCIKLASVLCTSVSYLLGLTDDPAPEKEDTTK